MGIEKPSLSVLIPNHNHGCFLEECLESLLSQSRAPDEIIVVDDASTDNSVQIAVRHAHRHSCIRVLRNERRLGVMGTLNRALREARCDYVYGGAADDKVLPGAFERVMNLLEAHPHAGLCFGHTLTQNPQTGHVSEHPLPLSQKPRFFMAHQLAESMGLAAQPGRSVAVPGNAAVWKRSEHLRCGGYRDELRWHADWFALQVIGMRQGACFVPEPLAVNRVDRASYSLAGQDCWESQQAVLTSLLKLLVSDEFRDVWPQFRTARLLSQFAPWVTRVVAGNPAHWTVEHVLLIEHSLLHFHRQLLEDDNPTVRQGAAVCLGLLGAGAVGAVAAVTRCRRDRFAPVAAAAVEANNIIRRESAGADLTRCLVTGHIGHAAREAGRWVKCLLHPLATLVSAGTDRRVMIRMAALEAENRRLVIGMQSDLRELRREIGKFLSYAPVNREGPRSGNEDDSGIQKSLPATDMIAVDERDVAASIYAKDRRPHAA